MQKCRRRIGLWELANDHAHISQALLVPYRHPYVNTRCLTHAKCIKLHKGIVVIRGPYGSLTIYARTVHMVYDLYSNKTSKRSPHWWAVRTGGLRNPYETVRIQFKTAREQHVDGLGCDVTETLWVAIFPGEYSALYVSTQALQTTTAFIIVFVRLARLCDVKLVIGTKFIVIVQCRMHSMFYGQINCTNEWSRFIITMSYQCGKSYCGDKTVVKSSYLYLLYCLDVIFILNRGPGHWYIVESVLRTRHLNTLMLHDIRIS